MKIFKKVVATCVGLLAITTLAACDNTNYNVDGAAKKVQLTQDNLAISPS